MKLKSDFYFPFCLGPGRPLLIEKCLCIPPQSREQDFPAFSWEDPLIFTTPQPLIVEYCSGNGQWISDMAKLQPHFNWIAVERDFDRARKVWLRVFRMQLDNLFVVYGEGLVFSRNYLPNSSVNQVYVNFPDPWPKRRHAKHRIIQKEFVDEMQRIIKPNGLATLVTDDEAYSEQMIALFSSWKSAFGSQHYVTDWQQFGDSFFHSLWKKQERVIRYHCFNNIRSEGKV